MEKIVTSLSEIPVGSSCRICNIDERLPIKVRLKELGFGINSCIDKIQTGPSGSPTAFRVCGAVIALRSEDTDKIYVTLLSQT